MKTRIVIDVEASKTMVDTMQRTGFTVSPDGTGMMIKTAYAPPITRRKTKIQFLDGNVEYDHT